MRARACNRCLTSASVLPVAVHVLPVVISLNPISRNPRAARPWRIDPVALRPSVVCARPLVIARFPRKPRMGILSLAFLRWWWRRFARRLIESKQSRWQQSESKQQRQDFLFHNSYLLRSEDGISLRLQTGKSQLTRVRVAATGVWSCGNPTNHLAVIDHC
jgi:hypothetical protein